MSILVYLQDINGVNVKLLFLEIMDASVCINNNQLYCYRFPKC